MNLLAVEKLAKNHGERILFEGLSFGLSQGDKVALIANNGTGKSSLLKIVAGIEPADGGEVVFRNKSRVSYLPQEATFNNNLTINELIEGSHNKISSLVLEYENAVELNSKVNSVKTQKNLDFLSLKMDQENAWDYARRTKQILTQFNITDFQKKVGSLSGGQKKRLSLALLLLEEADILLLDEPTNHLDIGMIEWLEKYLQQQKITLLMVTHDRYFLERVCNSIIELEGGKLYNHKGNYGYFLEQRTTREANFDVELLKAQKLMKKELEWMRRQPKARIKKSKSRIENFNRIKKKTSSIRLKKVLDIDLKMDRIGGKIMELKNIKKSYNDITILNGFNYTFKKGERIGVIGDNGVGKSSFLNIISGIEKADSGKLNTGETVNLGYFTQSGLKIDQEKRVINALRDIAEFIVMSDKRKVTASKLLEHFMFTPEMQFTQVKRLSGGEKKRLYLLTVLMQNPNFLILDEPTNDLDLLTLSKLEEFLLQFKGCLLLVSHDRFFMDKLTDHLFVFKGDGIIQDYYCTYSEYKHKQIEESKQLLKKDKSIEKKNQVSQLNPRKLSFNEKFEFENLSKDLVELEKKKRDLELLINDSSSEFDVIMESSKKLSETLDLIDQKELRWLELDDIQS